MLITNNHKEPSIVTTDPTLEGHQIKNSSLETIKANNNHDQKKLTQIKK